MAATLDVAMGQVTLRYHDLTRRDVQTALVQFKDLSPKKDNYVFTDGIDRSVLALEGTVPVNYKGAVYNIPICLYLLEMYPYHPPIVHVRPTAEMTIKTGKHVDHSGRVYLPYLHEWKHPSSDLTSLLQILCMVFAECPPVFARSSRSQPPSYPPYPNSGSGYYGGGTNASYTPGYNQPPYPTGYNSGGAGTPYPPYPTAANSGGYNSSRTNPTPPPYPPFSSYTGTTANSTPYPPSTNPESHTEASRLLSQGSVSEEYIRASVVSAVEDRVKRKLKEAIFNRCVETVSLKNTNEDLKKNDLKLSEIQDRIKNQKNTKEECERKTEEIKKVLEDVEAGNELTIDEAIDTTTPVFRQLLKCHAEDNAIEDEVYYIGEALREDKIDLDIYLTQVRRLSRKQFMVRATVNKCRRKAGLPEVTH